MRHQGSPLRPLVPTHGASRDAAWSYARWLDLPHDGYRYEIFDGMLLKEPPPSIPHQNVVTELAAGLITHLGKRQRQGLFVSPVGVRLAENRVIQPDITYVRPERHHIIGRQVIEGGPDLVCEVLSPSTKSRDLGIKRQWYAEHGVSEYWVIDPEGHSVTIYRQPESGGYTNSRRYYRGDRLSSELLKWEFDVVDLFR